MKKTHFISDLHLFCDRSVARKHLSAIHAAASQSQDFILGGDIFDLKWSRVGTAGETLKAASMWVEDLIRPYPHCRFHYLLGNHDCAPHFVEKLERLADNYANLQIHPYVLRINDSVFLHGDVADRLTDQQQLERSRNRQLHEKSKGEISNASYNAVIGMKLHLLATKWYYPGKVAPRILHYLESIEQGAGSGTSNVYFGHTHTQLSDYEFKGIRFHNGGAPIKGLRFKIVEVPFRRDEV